MKPKNKNEAKLYRKELEVRNGEPSRTQGIFSPSFSYLYFLYLSIYFSILQTSFLKLIHCCQIFIYILLIFLSFLENILILTLFLIDSFAEFKLHDTQLFSFNSLKIVFHYILDSLDAIRRQLSI